MIISIISYLDHVEKFLAIMEREGEREREE